MDLPASFYGELDERNPVLISFERDVKSFVVLMRQVASSTSRDNSSHAKGIKMIMEIWTKYRHRLPLKMYQERMLYVADTLYRMKLYQPALWQGYSLLLQQFSSVQITDITDVNHFMACFFPEGFDADQDTFSLKTHAMHGCALCIFEQEKGHRLLSQGGLCKLLQVLNFIRIMMQTFQEHEHLSDQIYNGSVHIYTICRYLMTENCSAQALEYLLWGSISLDLSISLMTPVNLPWIVTLYCAVCRCYYDCQADAQAEKFARKALEKIHQLKEQSEAPATEETQRVFKEASIKLSAMVFKRVVFEGQKTPKTKSTLKDMPGGPWPRTATERMLMDMFDSRPAQFLGILEALWDGSRHPLQNKMPDKPEMREVILQLMSAGISILSGVGVKDESLRALIPTATLIDLAIAGENKISTKSGIRFIKLLFRYSQPESFNKLAGEMLRVLPDVEGQSFRKAELELALLCSFNSLRSSQKSYTRGGNMNDEKKKSSFWMSNELTMLVETLHKSVCGSAPEIWPDGNLVLDVLSFLWRKVRVAVKSDQLQNLTHGLKKKNIQSEWLWCLYKLCEVASAFDLASVDCLTTAEMIHTLAVLLENAAEHGLQTQCQLEANTYSVKPNPFSIPQGSSSELLQKVCEIAEQGLKALAKGMSTLLPQDSSTVTDPAFTQKFFPLRPPTSHLTSPEDEPKKDDKDSEVKVDPKPDTHMKGCPNRCPRNVFLQALDLNLELDIIHHRASLKLLQLNAVTEAELVGRIKRNKVAKALFLMQKALLVHRSMGTDDSKNQTESLLKEACNLIEKAEVEERKLYLSTTCKTRAEAKDEDMMKKEENPPPAPILLSRTCHSFTFAPAPYNLEAEVSWYQLFGRPAEAFTQKTHLGDCSLPGTGNMVPAASGDCQLRVEGLEPNQKYVFAVAAYNSQGKLLGNTIGVTTMPLLASMALPLLTTWAHLGQVAFQSEQYAVAKRACRELWNHYIQPKPKLQNAEERFVTTGKLHVQTLENSSPRLCHLLHTSIFIEIQIQRGSPNCDSFSNNGPFLWEQEARLAECEKMLVAIDLATGLNDGSTVVHAVGKCYNLLAPVIFHQIAYYPVVQVLKKCLIALENNSSHLKRTTVCTEPTMNTIAIITYYLSKALQKLRDHHLASAMMDCGRRLLQEVYDAHVQMSKPEYETMGSLKANHTVAKNRMEVCPQLKALHWKYKTKTTSEAACTTENGNPPLNGHTDPLTLYDMISKSTLKDAYKGVMKLRWKEYFVELAALLLQRTLEEGNPELVLKWGQSIFECLSRREEVTDFPTSRRMTDQPKEGGTSKNAPHEMNKRQPHITQRRASTNRESRAHRKMLATMSRVVQCHKKQIQLRKKCCVEGVWKSDLNFSMAKAHLALLHHSLDQLLGGAPKHRYSQLNSLCFSLPYSGVLMWRDIKQQQPSEYEVISERDSPQSRPDECQNSLTEGSNKEGCTTEEGEDSVDQQTKMHQNCAATLLESLNKAALYLRRAMVLAHRGSYWTILQYVCQTVWDQSSRISVLVAHLEPPCPITAEQIHNIFTSLLVLSTDLIMDMLSKLGLWSLYDSDMPEEKLESSFHYSAPLDESTQVDLRWVCTLVLHTLERLYGSGKWESLAHMALIFNSNTRERYAWIVAPLIVHAQWRLLERINSFGGPMVPQPHHVKTKRVTGKEVTYRSYASSQLLSGWTPQPAQQTALCKKEGLTNSALHDTVHLKGAEKQHSMSLVCVPLDVEDSLRCYRQALGKRPRCLQVLQHGRSLLLQLLAYTQPRFSSHLQHVGEKRLGPSENLVAPGSINRPISPPNLMEEDYSTASGLYRLPLSPSHMPAITSAYSNSIKYLKANGCDSLRVQALHEKGNLHFYNENTRAAHSSWNKAVDCALQCSDAVEKWDGTSLGGGSMLQTLKQAGVFGCLHAAGLAAKIAQYIFTSDISQRTKCCLLSAHLFKCVLCCSLAQPQADLQYACHNIGKELLPGIDLFSEPHRVHLGTTVASLNFICHWLYATGYYTTVLPMLALYLHFVGDLCRDVQRTVESRILKIRTLTKLHLFTEAVKEAAQLTQGPGIFLTYGQYITKGNKPKKTFYSNRCLQDNAEALEELVSCDFAPDIRKLYGSALCLRFDLARIQLVLALSNINHGPSVPDSVVGESPVVGAESPGFSVNSEDRLDIEASCPNTDKPKVQKEVHFPEKIKCFLLERASSLLQNVTQQLTSESCSEPEILEMTVESKILGANLYQTQGQAALSSKMAISSLVLLQTSPVIMRRSKPNCHPMPERIDARTDSEQYGDCPRQVEADERIGPTLWLRCKLTLVRSLTAHVPSTTTPFKGKNSNREAVHLIQECLEECARWGDLETQALFMVEGAELLAKRGKIDDSVAMLQKAISLLTGMTYMPTGSCLSLARAILLLNDLNRKQSITLLKLTQKLLKKQLFVFGQTLSSDEGNKSFALTGQCNIYLPYLNLLNQVTSRIEQTLELSPMESRPSSSHHNQFPENVCST